MLEAYQVVTDTTNPNNVIAVRPGIEPCNLTLPLKSDTHVLWLATTITQTLQSGHFQKLSPQVTPRQHLQSGSHFRLCYQTIVPYRGSNRRSPGPHPACYQLHHMNFSPIVFPVLTLHGFPFNIVNATLLPLCRWFRSGEPRSRSPSTSLRTICFQGSPGTPVRLTLHIFGGFSIPHLLSGSSRLPNMSR